MDSLDALADILNTLSQSPFDISLHAQHIRLANSIKSFDPTHLSAAQEMLTAHFPAGDAVWMPLLKEKEESLDMKEAGSVLDMLELYTRAEGDYLCECTRFHPTLSGQIYWRRVSYTYIAEEYRIFDPKAYVVRDPGRQAWRLWRTVIDRMDEVCYCFYCR